MAHNKEEFKQSEEIKKDGYFLRNILFLDYDGVVNTLMWNEKGTGAYFNFPEDNKVNNFQSVQWISEFCINFKFDIVVISTWRVESNYKECLINGGLRKGIKILGRTKVLKGKSRGEEIQEYLDSHPEVMHFIIVDDVNDFLPHQQSHFVKTNIGYGFNRPDYDKCVKLYLRLKK